VKLVWAVSGRGMAARAVMEAHFVGLLKSKLDLVVFDRTGATDSMIQYCVINRIDFLVVAPTHLETELLEMQRIHQFDCMGLTFNRLIPQSVIDAFKGRIFNLHLSLLPLFPGFGATKKALESGLSHTGVTVHFIDAGIDTGPIIAQREVAIEVSDSEAELGRRQFEAAVPLLLQTIRMLESDRSSPFDRPDADLMHFGARYCLDVGIPENRV
jgi:phosphoribosylglycinamide formyltransferase 1